MRSIGNVMTSVELNVEDMKARTIDNNEVSLNITWGGAFGAVVTKRNNESNVSEGRIFVERSCPMLMSWTSANVLAMTDNNNKYSLGYDGAEGTHGDPRDSLDSSSVQRCNRDT